MPLNASNMVPNGHLLHNDIRQFVDLLTGTMTDQPVILGNGLEVRQRLAVHSFVEAQQLTTPAPPGFGYLRIYPKSDGCLYTLDPAGTERSLCGAQGPPGPAGTGTCDKPLRTYIRQVFSIIDPGGSPDPDDCADGGGGGTGRGTKWFFGDGPPPDPIPGALPGDLYLDRLNWNLYEVN